MDKKKAQFMAPVPFPVRGEGALYKLKKVSKQTPLSKPETPAAEVVKLPSTPLSLATALPLQQQNSLTAWTELYFRLHVVGGPVKTQQAKRRDLEYFLRFFQGHVGHDFIDGWTPAVSKQFQISLTRVVSETTGKGYSETTINRVMASVKHFGRWLHKQRPLLAGDPFWGVKDRKVEAPDWNGLTSKQVLRLKAACEQRLKGCVRKNQDPLLERALFYMLLQTGLRESEVVALNVEQYHHKGLHQVLRHKNKRVSIKVPLPQEAREALEQYLENRKVRLREEQEEQTQQEKLDKIQDGKRKDQASNKAVKGSSFKNLTLDPHAPLFVSRYGNRLAAQDVRRSCQRLLKQASAYLDPEEKFRVTPHMLRHTFLKQITDKHGVHFAQQMSGNISVREIFRYAKPSQAEMEATVEDMFR